MMRKLLLSFVVLSCSVNVQGMEGTSALYKLFRGAYPVKKDTNEFREALEALLEHGAQDNEYRKVLQTVVEHGDLALLKLLVEHKAVDITTSFKPLANPGYYKKHILHCAASASYRSGRLLDLSGVVAFLLQQPDVEVNVRDEGSNTPLHYVRTAGIAKLLLDHGADIHAVNDFGRTPLNMAVSMVLLRPMHDVISCLLLHGASLCVPDERGRTPLGWLKSEKSRECPEVLRCVQSPAGIIDDQWGHVKGRLFTLLCCLKRLRRIPRDVRRLIELYCVSAEADSQLYDTLSVSQLGWLVKRNLLSEKEVLDRLVARHFATLEQARSLEVEHSLPEPEVEEEYNYDLEALGYYKPDDRPIVFDKYLGPEMKTLKADHADEIRERYRRVLHGLPQEVEEPDDENK